MGAGPEAPQEHWWWRLDEHWWFWWLVVPVGATLVIGAVLLLTDLAGHAAC